ncbi:unnamed protein product [Phyllotreta striolata]|uniref:Mitochondrial cytochrome c oxidase subunit VIc/VIIs domain-containing protein n=1 Tax=Phyllotreta striolata TaxID=444603 RepID=A0A9N9XTF3_PHYSR|nr:unnamed protein product [Phyllotreta striolata]
MSAEVAGKLPKPQMRGLLHRQIKRNLVIAGIACFIGGAYMRFVYGARNKKAYADFYLNFDAEKTFHEMRRKGVFNSCDTDDDDE